MAPGPAGDTIVVVPVEKWARLGAAELPQRLSADLMRFRAQ
jgi:hypothetical protein